MWWLISNAHSRIVHVFCLVRPLWIYSVFSILRYLEKHGSCVRSVRSLHNFCNSS